MVSVVLKDGESQRSLANRFRKKVIRSKVLGEIRKRRWFVSRNEQRRIDKKKAIRHMKQKQQTNNHY